jgi:hypothetical protein
MRKIISVITILFLTGCSSLDNKAPCYNVFLRKVKREEKLEPGFHKKISRMDFFLEQSIRFMLEGLSSGDNCSNLNLEITYKAQDPFNKVKKTQALNQETMDYKLNYKLKRGQSLIAQGTIRELDSFLIAKQLYPSLLSGEASQVATAEALTARLEVSLRRIIKKLNKNNNNSYCGEGSLIVE